MTLRRIKLSAVVMVLCVLFVTPGVAQPTGRGAVTDCDIVNGYWWVGCGKGYSGDTCRDIFWDPWSGFYYICRPCGACIAPNGCENVQLSWIEWCD